MALAFLVGATTVSAQSAKDLNNERKEILKMSKSELNAKASKAARKEAKALAKQGWVVSPGALPLEKQLDRAYNMQYELDENLLPKYLMSEGQSIGEVYDAAKMQALELAKQNLAGQIETEIARIVENQVSNEQLAAEQAASVVESVSASKNFITTKIGRVVPIVECYRKLKNKQVEVLVRVAYSTTVALNDAKEPIREDLRKKGDKLAEQLDKALGF